MFTARRLPVSGPNVTLTGASPGQLVAELDEGGVAAAGLMSGPSRLSSFRRADLVTRAPLPKTLHAGGVRALWEDTLDPDDRAALDPGLPEGLDRAPDVLVVGGGIVGLATAVMCRRVGLGRVVVVERGRLAGGVSGSAAGGLSPGTHALTRPPAFVTLARSGLEAWRELDASLDGRLGLRTVDWIVALDVPVDLRTARAAGLEAVDGDEARTLEPELGEFGAGLVVREQAHVHPLRAAAELARAAGTAVTGVRVAELEAADGRLRTVRTTAGDFTPGAVVLATGTTSELRVPQPSVKGHLVALPVLGFRLRFAVATPATLAVQLDDGTLVGGGTFDVGDEDPAVREHVVRGILDELGRLVPRVRGIEPSHAWCCFRPSTPDELPIIDRVPGYDNVWANAGHHRTGLLVAPAAGRAVASWIATGARPPEVEAFGAGRFG